MIYIITCKNDFPPVNEYNIQVYSDWSSTPGKYLSDRYSMNVLTTVSKDRLVFITKAEDLAEAVITFWQHYMYGGVK